MKKILFVLLSLFLVACQDDKPGFQGYIEGDYTYLSSPKSGALTSLAAHRGDTVKQNTLLYALDNKPEVFTSQEKKSNLSKAQDILNDMQRAKREEVIIDLTAKREHADATYRFLVKKHQRHKLLFNSNVLDRNTYDETVSNLEKTRALIKQYTAQIKNAKRSRARIDTIKAQEDLIHAYQSLYDFANWQLEQKKGYAPADGVIMETYYRVGEYVRASSPVIKLLSPQNKYVLFFVKEPELASLKLGQMLTINCDACKPNNQAKVSFISPKAEFTPPLVFSRDNNSKLIYKVRAKLMTPDTFHPGQPVIVNLVKKTT